jgi:hypothetical protein
VDEAETILWRIERLQAAIDALTGGNVTAFGAMLGYKDGAFVRQMLSGTRAISEKTVRKIEAQRGMARWFSEDRADPAAGELSAQIRAEIAARDVPEQVLRTILAMLQGFPLRQKAA